MGTPRKEPIMDNNLLKFSLDQPPLNRTRLGRVFRDLQPPRSTFLAQAKQLKANPSHESQKRHSEELQMF